MSTMPHPSPAGRGSVRTVPARRGQGRRLVDSSALFLWLMTVCILLGIVLYRIDVLWTLLLVMCTSLFLGLFTFALIAGLDIGQDPAGLEPDPTRPTSSRTS